MLVQAASIHHNGTLDNIIAQYKTNNATRHKNSVWSYLVTGQSNPNISIYSLASLTDYNIYFIYGFSCNRSLADEKVVKIQNKTDFCWRYHPISPACTTHQLMAFRFMQRTGCEDQKFVADSITTLAGYVKQQSTYDFRVVDVYLQRVLLQMDSGHKENINPRWVKRILQHQYADGGWGSFQPLIPVGDGKYFGFHTKGVGIQKLESSFHTTAQGVWLMAMLMNQAAQ